MVQPSPSYTVALYLEVPASQKAVARLVDTATATGAIVTGVDVADSDGDKQGGLSPVIYSSGIPFALIARHL